jgi:glycosyltransferase involved in cell wall biosynthesis
MNLLFLVPCIPKINGVGWEQRAFHFLKSYSQVAEVDLICINFGDTTLDEAECLHLTNMCHSVEILRVDQAISPSNFVQTIQRIFTLSPLFSTVVPSQIFAEILKKQIVEADFIHASRLEMFSFLPRETWSRTLLDLDECHVTTLRRSQRFNFSTSISDQLRSLIRYLDTFRITYYQKYVVKRVCAAFICSEVERNRVSSSSQLQVLPNVAKSLPYFPNKVDSQQKNLLFIGNLSTSPNIDAVLYFVTCIWQKVLEQHPTCRLMIVGRNPCDQILALAGSEGIEIHANVANLDEVYQNATIALVPLRFGAGTKLKVLEAFGYGVPVVTTSVGSEGIDVQNDDHLLVADSSEAFAEACLRLLAEPETRQRLALSAWNYTRKNHDPTAIQQMITTRFSDLTSMAATQAPD